MGHTVVLKGAGSVVASPDGSWDIVGSGSPALATACTGDVLAGIVAALLAQDREPHDAAALGAWLHGAGGEEWTRRHPSGTGMSAARLPSLVVDALDRLSDNPFSPAPDRAALFTQLAHLVAARRGTRIAALFDAEPGRLARFTLDAAGLHLDLSRQRIADGDLDALLALGSRARRAGPARRATARRARQRHREPAGAAHRAAPRSSASAGRRRRRPHGRRRRGPAPDARVLRGGARGPLARRRRRADRRRGRDRHRRLAPGPAARLRGAARARPPPAARALPVERRPRRVGGAAPPARRARHAGRRGLEVLAHARDRAQCRSRAPLAARGRRATRGPVAAPCRRDREPRRRARVRSGRRRASSRSATGSAAASRCGPRSAFR